MICVPITAATTEDALVEIFEANSLPAELIELRVDYMKKPDLKKLIAASKKRVVVTNRKESEGGHFKGTEEKRIALLKEAIEDGADYIDIEYSTPAKLRNALIKKKGKTRIILSFHDFKDTPFPQELVRQFTKMNNVKGADIIKIVTYARNTKDPMIMLGFIQKYRKIKKLIAFCMGPMGKDSRILSVPFGACITYGALSRDRASAPGQLTVNELKMNYSGLGLIFGS